MSKKTRNIECKNVRTKQNNFHRKAAQLMIDIQDEVLSLESELEKLTVIEQPVLVKMISLETIVCLKKFLAKIQ